MSRIRVAHVITRLCKGGAQENTFHTVRLANTERFDVDLISGPTSGSEGSIEDAVHGAGIDIIREPHLVREVAPLRDLLALRSLTRLFRTERYHIVHTHTSKAGFVGRLAAARAGVPIVVHTPHGNVFDGYFSRWLTELFVRMERYAARKTTRLIALTPEGAAEDLAHGIGAPGQYVTIFSGVDFAPCDHAVERRIETRRSLAVHSGEFLVGGVGRLEPVKGFAYFIQAAGLIAEALPEARFVLAGNGSQYAELAAQAGPLRDRFVMLGMREDVPELMAAMDVFVLPSLNEGMGRVLLEASAVGTPSVASNVGGVPDIVKHERNGILVPPRDPRAIAGAVISLARDPERRKALAENARKSVVPAYSIERMVEQIESLYEELIKEKRIEP
ncbi:MAG: glycosyltransferase family 4 protein [Candidatus Hydrogenedentes bacterium]|nr:glycosyltransferase family 4 protein [Candidatus Hydrogenedentota bacterium]